MQLRSKHSLPMQSRYTFTTYHALRSVDSVAYLADEIVDHLVSSCSYLVQRENKGRHDAIASLIHWTLLKQAGCQVCSPWWRHIPTTVWENDEYKVLWDFTIVTDSVIHHDIPDIVLTRKTSNEIFMIDVAIPGESRISQKNSQSM